MKDKIIMMLLQSRGEYISGEMISNGLGVSRTSVWKYINQLREEGFGIDSVSNKGYCLKYTPGRLNKTLLEYNLTTDSIGGIIELHDSVGSTNMIARELAQQGAAHGTLVAAEEQVQGKGRLGRTWVSPHETGIWMSLILRPAFLPRYAPRITIIAALAVTDAVNRVTGLKAGIKWPNDIIIGSKKVRGILTELQAEPDMVEYIVLGIGINVNTSSEDLPEELCASATSLRIESGKRIDRNILLPEILKSFEVLYDKYEISGNFSDIMHTYKKQCISINRRVRVFGRTEEFEGTAFDLTDECGLLVRLDSGDVREVISGDVSVRGIAGYV